MSATCALYGATTRMSLASSVYSRPSAATKLPPTSVETTSRTTRASSIEEVRLPS